MDKITHKVYQYTALFEPDEENGGYSVTVPALPGCISEGNTFEEALVNIKEAASLYVEEMFRVEGQVEKEERFVITPIQVTV